MLTFGPCLLRLEVKTLIQFSADKKGGQILFGAGRTNFEASSLFEDSFRPFKNGL
jgi:hypothetical protein